MRKTVLIVDDHEDFRRSATALLDAEGFDVVGVVTQPDKPVGRSRSTLQPSPVKLGPATGSAEFIGLFNFLRRSAEITVGAPRLQAWS